MFQRNEFLRQLYAGLARQEQDFRNANLNQLVCRQVQGRSVLDLGCGAGALVQLLRNQGFDALGLEPDSNLVQLSSEYFPEIEVRCGTSESIAALNRTFDAVTAIDVIEHIHNDVAALHNIYAALHPGGTFVVVVPAHTWLYGERDRKNGHFRRYSSPELVRKVKSVGFQIQSIRSWNALGVLPYWVSERILGRALETDLRGPAPQGWRKRTLKLLLNRWFKHVENRISFGFGLSLICVARKPDVGSETIPFPSEDRALERPSQLRRAA